MFHVALRPSALLPIQCRKNGRILLNFWDIFPLSLGVLGMLIMMLLYGRFIHCANRPGTTQVFVSVTHCVFFPTHLQCFLSALKKATLHGSLKTDGPLPLVSRSHMPCIPPKSGHRTPTVVVSKLRLDHLAHQLLTAFPLLVQAATGFCFYNLVVQWLADYFWPDHELGAPPLH